MHLLYRKELISFTFMIFWAMYPSCSSPLVATSGSSSLFSNKQEVDSSNSDNLLNKIMGTFHLVLSEELKNALQKMLNAGLIDELFVAFKKTLVTEGIEQDAETISNGEIKKQSILSLLLNDLKKYLQKEATQVNANPLMSLLADHLVVAFLKEIMQKRQVQSNDTECVSRKALKHRLMQLLLLKILQYVLILTILATAIGLITYRVMKKVLYLLRLSEGLAWAVGYFRNKLLPYHLQQLEQELQRWGISFDEQQILARYIKGLRHAIAHHLPLPILLLEGKDSIWLAQLLLSRGGKHVWEISSNSVSTVGDLPLWKEPEIQPIHYNLVSQKEEDMLSSSFVTTATTLRNLSHHRNWIIITLSGTSKWQWLPSVQEKMVIPSPNKEAIGNILLDQLSFQQKKGLKKSSKWRNQIEKYASALRGVSRTELIDLVERVAYQALQTKKKKITYSLIMQEIGTWKQMHQSIVERNTPSLAV